MYWNWKQYIFWFQVQIAYYYLPLLCITVQDAHIMPLLAFFVLAEIAN